MSSRMIPMRVWTVALLSLFPIVAFADKDASGEWKEINDKDGIKVFRKAVEGSQIVAFRGVTIVDAPMGKILHVLQDNDHRTEWVDRLYISKVLEQPSSSEFLVYAGFKLPALFKNRDYVYRGKAWLRKDGSAYVIIKSEEHPNAPPTIGVRAWLNKSLYLLTPVEGGAKTRVDVEVHTDPRGSIPIWLVNLIQKSWPHKTLAGIKKQVTKPFVVELPPPPPEPASEEGNTKL